MPGLEDLYREIILDHHRNPRNRGELAPPAPHAVGHNPLCGDEIDRGRVIQINKDHVIVDIGDKSEGQVALAEFLGPDGQVLLKEGDEIDVYLQVENDVVVDVKVGGQGCSISQSSASMMSQAIKGKPVTEVRALVRRFKGLMSIPDEDGNPIEPDPEVKLGDLEALQGVVKFPVRIKCATLSWNTLLDALAQA